MVRVAGSPFEMRDPATVDRTLDQMIALLSGENLSHWLACDYDPNVGSTTFQLTPSDQGNITDRKKLRAEMMRAVDLYRLAFN